MIRVALDWLSRRKRPALPVASSEPLDLVAESAQREGDGATVSTALKALGPPGLGAGLGARLDGEPDPLVFGDPDLQSPGPGYMQQDCECGVQWAAHKAGACWNCGKPVSP